MGAIKRKADQGAAPSKKAKGASTDRSAKRRKSDVDQQSPAKPKPESAAPKPSVFKDEEKSFPRGGASVLTPLEHKQIQIKANQDVLFEQSGVKRTGGGDDEGYSDMGSEDDERAAPKSKKKQPFKKSKQSHESGEKEDMVRVEGLSYKVRQTPRSLSAGLTVPEIVAWNHCSWPDYRHFPPRHRACPPQ